MTLENNPQIKNSTHEGVILATSGYRIGCVDNVLFVIFEQFEKHFLAEIFHESIKIYRKIQRPLVILVLLAPDTEPPNRMFVEENMRFLREGKSYLAKIVAVLQGTGMKKAFIRAIASNIMLSASDRGNMAVADTVTNGLLACKEHLQMAPAEIMAKAASMGLLL